MQNKISVLVAVREQFELVKSARKTIDARTGETIASYNAGLYFELIEASIDGIEDLYRFLDRIQHNPKAFVVRGQSTAHFLPNGWCKRRSVSQGGEPAFFFDQAKIWMVIDCDDVIAPKGISPTSEEAVEYVISLLPAEFRDVSYVC